jgi:hypothetical protein
MTLQTITSYNFCAGPLTGLSIDRELAAAYRRADKLNRAGVGQGPRGLLVLMRWTVYGVPMLADVTDQPVTTTGPPGRS